MKVQIALQGGGAKLVALIAAMAAVQDLSDSRVIQVTRISGTSAGSIVAALFAAGVPMREALTYLESLDSKKLFPKRFMPPHWHVLRGQPVFDIHDTFQKIFLDLMDKGTRRRSIPALPAPKSFSDLNIPTYVTVSDLQERRSLTKSGGHLIFPSVYDSCSLPFGLKSRKSRNNAWVVDGGLCENLPAEMLNTGRSEFGPIMAFSFPRDGGFVDDGILGYAKALLFTAIDAEVDRVKKRLDEGSVHEIGTSVETLDFDKAVGSGLKALDAEIKSITASTQAFVNKFVHAQINQTKLAAGRIAELTEDPWKASESSELLARSVTAAMQNLFRLHQSSSRCSKIRYVSSTLLVEGLSLKALNGPQQSQNVGGSGDTLYDNVTTQTCYKVTDGQLISHAVAMGLNAGNLLKTQPCVEHRVADKYVPLVNPVFNAAAINPDALEKRYMLICFKTPLPTGTDFRLTIADQVGGFLEGLLSEKRTDFLSILPTRSSTDPISKVEIALLVPPMSEFDIVMEAHPSMEAGNEGRAMTEEEIKIAAPTAPSGWKWIGWRWENSAINGKFVVALHAYKFVSR